MFIRDTATPLFILLILILMAKTDFAQSGLCDPIVPFYQVNLMGNPNGSWVSNPPIARKGNCCGTVFPDRCIEFEVTLDSNALGIQFDIAKGAVPSGSMYYQIDCGPLVKVGEMICVNGPGPFTLTFCKPGNNLNTYQITSIPGPVFGPDEIVRKDCPKYIWASGLDPATIVWNDISSGNGQYNSFLSCTKGCDSTLVSYDPNAPDSVLYQVCGLPLAESCLDTGTICDTITVYFQNPLKVSIYPTAPVFCETDSGILVTASASGGDGNYQYTWYSLDSNTIINDSSSSVFITQAGNYSIKLDDTYSDICPGDSLIFQVSVDSLLTINAGADQYICYAASAIELNASLSSSTGVKWYGGNGQYLPNDSMASINYVPSANEINTGYVNLFVSTLTQNACNNPIENVTIFLYKPLQLAISGPEALCKGNSITLSATNSGGMPPYTYLWSNGSVNNSIQVNTAGAYSLTISSAGADSGCIASDTITIIAPPDFVISLPPLDSIICDSIKDVAVSATPQGNYSYQWSNLDTTAVSSLTPGFYWVNVKDSFGCVKSDSISLYAINSDLFVEIKGNDSICYGDSVLLLAQISGGVKPYTINWNTGSTDSIIYAGGGFYCVTVIDFLGCKYSTCFEVKEDGLINVGIIGDSLICPATKTYIYLEVQGTQGSYSLLWNNGNVSAGMDVYSGFYSAVVTDNWGCKATDSIMINNSTVLPPVFQPTNPSCYGYANGSVCIQLMDKITNGFFNNIPFNNDTCFQALSAGQYDIQKIDTNGCLFYDSIIMKQPDLLNLVVDSIKDNICYDNNEGEAWLSANGGTGPYQYVWSPGVSSTNYAQLLASGNYIVTVLDSASCKSTKKFTIQEPGAISVIEQAVSPTCYGNSNGSIYIVAGGGTPPYNYFWPTINQYGQQINNLTAGTYIYEVTDNNNCVYIDSVVLLQPDSISIQLLSLVPNKCYGDSLAEIILNVLGGSGNFIYNWLPNVSTTNAANHLPSGTYQINVQDANGCVDSITILIKDPDVLQPGLSPDKTVTCNDTIHISNTISGGTSPYTVLWSTGDTTQNLSHVGSGIYSVYVSDDNGCLASGSVTILSSDSLSAGIKGPSIICPGANSVLEVFPVGGPAPYQYLWSNNDTSKIITTDSTHIGISVIDGLGCIANAKFSLNVDSISFQLNSDLLACYEDSEYVSVSVINGISPFKIIWDSQLVSDTALLSAGLHSVTVQDSLGCIQSKGFNIVEAAEIEIMPYAFPVSCPGMNDGYAVVYVTGGSPAYQYNWTSVNDTNPAIYYLAPGFYPINVSDKNSCTASDTVQILENSNIPLTNMNTIDESCKGNDGVATVIISGGVQPYSILWSNNDTNAIANNLTNGMYLVYVADSYGCMVNDTASIFPYNTMLLNYNIIKPVSCYGYSDASVGISYSGGTGNVELFFNNNFTLDSVFTNLAAGAQVILLKDSFGCVVQDTLQISQPDSMYLSSYGIKDSIKCKGDSSGTYSFVVNGGNGTLMYYWNNKEILTSTVVNIKAGTYFLSIIDSMGCLLKDSVIFNDPLPINLDIFNDTLICDNDTVEVKAIASGGKGGFSYNWNPGISTDSIISIKLVSDTIITVEVTDSAGCKSNMASTKISPFLSAQTPAVLTDYDICLGDSIFIEIDPGMGYTFINLFYDTALVAQSSGEFVFYPDTNHTLILITTDVCNNTVSDMGNITVHKAPPILLNDSISGCAPLEVHAENIFTSSSAINYTWTLSGITTNTQQYNTVLNSPGTYYLTLTGIDSYGCKNELGDSTKIIVYSNPVAGFLLNDNEFYLGSAYVSCTDQSTDAYTWSWDFGDGSTASEQNTSHVYKTIGDYYITQIVQNEYGCLDTLVKKIEVSEDFTVYFPNTFTPNGDGTNPIFNISATGVTDFEMYIFNRWGEQIFDTHDINEGWNGVPKNYKNAMVSSNKIAQQEIYVYLVILKDNEGEVHRYIGNVNLIR